MTRNMNHRNSLLFAAALFGGDSDPSPARRKRLADQQDVASAVHAKLNKSQFKDVQVTVDANGIATLSGTVADYEYKADADKIVHKVKGVSRCPQRYSGRRTRGLRRPVAEDAAR